MRWSWPAPPAMQGAARAHVGYYLVDRGQAALKAKFGYRARLARVARRLGPGAPQGDVFRVDGRRSSGLLMALVAGAGLGASVASWWLPATLLVLLLPMSELAVGLVNHLLTLLLPPGPCPSSTSRTASRPTAPRSSSCPRMLSRPQSAAALLERLEIHYLANPDPQLRFALLTDFADAPHETMPEDDAYLRDALERVAGPQRALSAATGPTNSSSSTAAGSGTRRRAAGWAGSGSAASWRSSTACSGAIARRATRSRAATRRACRDIRFVITLDADTQMPREAASRLVGTLAHPLNQPRFDPECGGVVEGYGVLQPRVSFHLTAATHSRFAALLASSGGIDPYSTAASDTYMDLFGIGSFTGKGIYDVDAFEAATGHAFPENHILSHDLIEGNFARCGLLSDTELFDDFPARYHAYARREHRWVRGDWQILPWLGRRVPTAEGPTRQPLADHGALEDLRQPAAEPGPARPGRAAGPRLDGPAGLALALDAGGAGRAGAAAVAARDRHAAGWRPQPVARGAEALAGQRPRRGGAGAAVDRLPGRSGAGAGRCDRADPGPACASRGATSWSGRPPRRPKGGWGPAWGSSSRACGPRRPWRWRWGPRWRRSVPGRWGGGPHPRRLVLLAGRRLLGQPAQARRRRPLDRRASGTRCGGRPQDLALLRDLRRRRGPLAPPRQLPGVPRRQGRAPDLADQPGAAPALDPGRPRPRLHRAPRPGPAAGEDLRHARPPGDALGPLLQLVRHADAPAARPDLRLDGRQRQPAGLPRGDGAGPEGEGRASRSSAPRSCAGFADTLDLVADGDPEACRPVALLPGRGARRPARLGRLAASHGLGGDRADRPVRIPGRPLRRGEGGPRGLGASPRRAGPRAWGRAGRARPLGACPARLGGRRAAAGGRRRMRPDAGRRSARTWRAPAASPTSPTGSAPSWTSWPRWRRRRRPSPGSGRSRRRSGDRPRRTGSGDSAAWKGGPRPWRPGWISGRCTRRIGTSSRSAATSPRGGSTAPATTCWPPRRA